MSAIKSGEEVDVAIVDFGPFIDGSNKQAVADAMVASFKEIGFVYLINHGLPKEKIDGMFDWSRRFFSQPMEVKLLAPHPPSGTHHRGYSAPGIEKVSHQVFDAGELAQQRAKASDSKESFECGREDAMEMPNIWLPEGTLPGFKEACLDFFWTCYQVELTVLRALALGLNLSEDFFLPYHTKSDNQLRLLHYPRMMLVAWKWRIHTGQANSRDIKAVPPVQGAIVVNAGDFMMRWSNDVIKSSIHRVGLPHNLNVTDGMLPERYSIPYFCSADLSTVVDCLPGTYNEDRPKRYQPISAAEYIMKRLAANY